MKAAVPVAVGTSKDATGRLLVVVVAAAAADAAVDVEKTPRLRDGDEALMVLTT